MTRLYQTAHKYFCAGTLAIAIGLRPDVLQAATAQKPRHYCPILDNLLDPRGQASLAFIPESRVGGHGTATMAEVDAEWELAFWRNLFRGDVDFGVAARDTLFFGSGGLELPSQLLRIALDVGWTGRFQKDLAVVARATPGMYAEPGAVGGSSLFVPVSCALVRTFRSDLAGLIGLECRPGFEDVLLPMVALQGEEGDDLHFRLGLPESFIVWEPNRFWDFRLRLLWSNVSYRLADDRERITLEDFRCFFSAHYFPSDTFLLTGELGYIFGRTVEFGDDPRGEKGLANTWFARVGVGVPF